MVNKRKSEFLSSIKCKQGHLSSLHLLRFAVQCILCVATG
uniref:Uncharacterized protein n=1 Tax=Heterorhabditis bacteriophora TaxID=37862 RepID=A0A1I7WHL5_HETBA